MLTLTLPYPPTVNTYWRRVGHRFYISPRGQRYREQVQLIYGGTETYTCPVVVEAYFNPPDRRERDVDNLPKALLDSLEYAGVFENDNQVKRLVCEMMQPRKGGRAVVFIREFKPRPQGWEPCFTSSAESS